MSALFGAAVLVERTQPDGDVTSLFHALDLVREVIGINEDSPRGRQRSRNSMTGEAQHMSEHVQTYFDRTEEPGSWRDLTYKARRTFTMKLDSGDRPEVDELRSKIARLQRQLLEQEIERDVATHRVLPGHRDLFVRHSGDQATEADWRSFRAATPRPTVYGRHAVAKVTADREIPNGPYAEVAVRARDKVGTLGGSSPISRPR